MLKKEEEMSKHLITSALPYINGVKHLGNLVGSLLPADVTARFFRQQGDEVLFICATDEHGTPAELAALEKGQDVETFCNEQYEIQKDIYERFGLSFDHFGRTSRPQNEELTQHMCEVLSENGYITERTVKQVYSAKDGRFLPDRYVEGTCPFCGYERARGDQCENCTHLLDPTDLLNPHSAISGSTDLEIRDSKHLFLQLPKLSEEVSKWVLEKKNIWSPLVYSIANKWLKEGLQERCITRDLQWGIPVNRAGFEGKVFYVWFDAPIGYISATKEWSDIDPANRDWQDWWYDAEDVIYTEFMAKDNIPFHTVTFPACLIGSKEPWKKVDQLKGFNWLTYYGGKFSTSQKRGVFTDQALDEFPADYWRYWLMANAPESSDSSFTFVSFANAINKDLNDTLGNFINRVTKISLKNFGEEIPAIGSFTQAEVDLGSRLNKLINSYTENLNKLSFRKALGDLRSIWVEGNNYVAVTEPWKVVKTDKDRAATILCISFNLMRIFAILSYPIIPTSSEKILLSLGIKTNNPGWIKGDIEKELSFFKGGESFIPLDPLFNKITPERIEELTSKYGKEEE